MLGVAAFLLIANASAAGNVEQGKKLYATLCVACHSVDYNGIGPAHKGVFGRKAGSAKDYAYSPALQSSAVVWNASTLDRWLDNPEKFIPGQKMGFSVKTARERADLIAFLQSVSAP